MTEDKHKEIKYLGVYAALKTRIEGGDLPVGALLPTEEQLCAEQKVSRNTVRQALRLLERKGFIERRKRAGTRVIARSSSSTWRHVYGSQSDLLDFVRGTTLRLSEPRLIQADSQLARLLGCDELRRWYVLEGVRVEIADERPIAVVQIYIDADRATVPAGIDFGHRPVYEWLAKKYNIRAKTVSQDLTAITLGEADARALREHSGSSSLRIVRRYFDSSRRIFQITVTVYRSTDFGYNIKLQLDEQ